MPTTEYHVTGMSCGPCEQSVRDEVLAVPGIEHVEVMVSTDTLTVHSQFPIDDSLVLAAVDAAGYRAENVE